MGPRLDAKAGKMITEGGYQKYNPGTPVEGVRKTAPFHAARSPKNGSNHGMAQAVLKRLENSHQQHSAEFSRIQQLPCHTLPWP